MTESGHSSPDISLQTFLPYEWAYLGWNIYLRIALFS